MHYVLQKNNNIHPTLPPLPTTLRQQRRPQKHQNATHHEIRQKKFNFFVKKILQRSIRPLRCHSSRGNLPRMVDFIFDLFSFLDFFRGGLVFDCGLA